MSRLGIKLTIGLALFLVAFYGVNELSDDSSAEIVTGTCGSNLNWSYNTDTNILTISGSGTAMTNFYIETTNCPWEDYSAEMTKVVFNTPNLRNIGSYAFNGCGNLEYVVLSESATVSELPSTLTTIGQGAFYLCSNLTLAEIPDGVTSISSAAFVGCEKITLSSLPNGITVIEADTFSACVLITLTSLPDNITYIGNGAFGWCTNLALTHLPSKLKTIDGQQAFGDCPNLAITSLPDTLEYIGVYAFTNDTSITLSSLPEYIKTIQSSAFYGCTGMSESLDVYCSPTTLGNGIFSGSSVKTVVNYGNSTWTSQYVGAGVTVVKGYPHGECGDDLGWFYDSDSHTLTIFGTGDMYSWPSASAVPWYTYATQITYVSYMADITSIGANAFRGCTGLTNANIPDSIVSIGDNAFRGCTGMTTMSLPDGLQSIGSSVFRGDTSLPDYIRVYCSPTSLGDDIFYQSSITRVYDYGTSDWGPHVGLGVTVIYPDSGSCGESLMWSFNKMSLTLIISGNGTTMTDYGDSHVPWYHYLSPTIYAVTKVKFTTTHLTNISPIFMKGATHLESVEFPNTITTIGDSAFEGCVALNVDALPPNITVLGNGAFKGCTALTLPSLPSRLTVINNSVFEGCTALSLTELPIRITTIGNNAFYGCALTITELPPSLTTIGSYAFTDNDIYELTVDEELTSIGTGAFYGCTDLKFIINESMLDISPASTDYGYIGYYADTVVTPEIGIQKVSEMVMKKEPHTLLLAVIPTLITIGIMLIAIPVVKSKMESYGER